MVRPRRVQRLLQELARGPVERLRAEFDTLLIDWARDTAPRRPPVGGGSTGKTRRWVFDERQRAFVDAQCAGWRRVRGLGHLLDEALAPDEIRDTALRRRLWRARWGLDARKPLARPITRRMRAEACWYLAEDHLLFGNNRTRPWDPWARAAAEAGHGKASDFLGETCRDRARTRRARPNDRRESVRWFRLGAAQGDGSAMLSLGYALFYGKGVRRDHVAAGRWYKAAVAAVRPRTDWGDPTTRASASTNLGHMYRRGEGVKANLRTAIRWYHRGAAGGNANAAYALWRIYGGREGAPARPSFAERWRRICAKQGNAEAVRAGRKTERARRGATVPG